MAEVTAAQVKELRELTGAGMMDCKRALVETDGDVEKAKDWLRAKGMARAADKAHRATSEGIVESYVHGGGVSGQKLGVLLEVNCESDFVAKTDDFRQLAKELALQVAGRSPLFVRREDVPPVIVERERAVFLAQVVDKPANIQEKIVEGKLDAYFAEVCLLEQPYVRDEKGKKKVSELVNEAVAKLKENITISRFARFQVGESATVTGDRSVAQEDDAPASAAS
ncbi:MAG: translation elongation factor Ts [Candidatus Dormibacteraeota bacterium]|uniref:Elongation factor Ts n=1 Tax=Candidatus Aeolococcus gillhamiae TaxID=3127015 RepID=A0A2W5Z7A4_9BACT|nr:translation elongation factor Ts [Candidatus Dormibacteraeota bacterium]PZR81212.1 MAG: translation elongation factor Ts [Candidatus Dormibacter sp. RRmetagenome_bin12]